VQESFYVGRRPAIELICHRQFYCSKVNVLLTPHRIDGISPFDYLATKGFSCEGAGGIATLNARLLGVEVEDHIGVPVSIYIL